MLAHVCGYVRIDPALPASISDWLPQNAIVILIVAAGSPGDSRPRRRLRTDDRTDWPSHRRPENGRRAAADGLIQPRPLPARRRAGPGEDTARQHRFQDLASVVQTHPF